MLITTDVSVHFYPNIQGGGVSDLNRTQLPLQEKPFPPKGNTKTGQTSITITLIKRETKAQHSSRQWTTLQSQNRFKSKLERYGQSCYWTPSAKDKAAQTNRSLVLVSSWALNVAKRHHLKVTLANFSQVNVNKKGSCSLRAFGYLRFNKGGEKKALVQLPQKSRCQQFWAIPSVLVSSFFASPHALTLCCALHFPDASDGLRSEVRIYTVILYLLDEHICLLQGPHT